MANRIFHPKSLEGKKIVTIIGGGFAGLASAKIFAEHKNVHVVLIDQKNHHLFQPLLYQVATAGLNPSDIAVPIRSQFSRDENIEVHLGRVEKINLEEKFVVVKEFEFLSDYIVVAAGAKHSYFSHPEWEKFAPGLKTLSQATEIRRRILMAFEKAENEVDPTVQSEYLTFVVIGGGPTGVELAGALAEISKTVLVHDFKRINSANAKIILIEGNQRVLKIFDEKSSKRTKKDLEDLGVEVLLNTVVENITEEGVQYGNQFIRCKTVFWAAGVLASKMEFSKEIEKDRNGRIVVSPDFSIPGYPDVFVVGDMAAAKISEDQYLPGLAPAAIQSGEYVADLILKKIAQVSPKPFKFSDKGLMATIGKNRAVAQFCNFSFHGRLAWLAWLFIHILYLIGFKNKLSVLFQWFWSYIFSKRGSRLIIDKDGSLE